MPIVTDIAQYRSYKFERCPEALQVALGAAWRPGPAVLTAVECALQLTDSDLGTDCMRNGQFARAVPMLVGAINSSRFMAASPVVRYAYTRLLLAITDIAEGRRHPELAQFAPNQDRRTDELTSAALSFEALTLNATAVEIWRAWPVRNRLRATYWLPLRPLYERLGAAWTRALHETLSTHFASSRQTSLPGLQEFATFVASLENISATLLSDRAYVTDMWRSFWEHYNTSRLKSASARTVVNAWSQQWVPTVTKVLQGAGLFASPFGAFPGPNLNRARPVRQAGESGVPNPASFELLIDAPEHVSDTQSLELFLQRLPLAVAAVRKWATHTAEQLYATSRRRRALARLGKVRPLKGPNGRGNGERWSTDRNNPQHLANAAATYEAYGPPERGARRVGSTLTYPIPLPQTARELGLPVAGALFAHACLLVFIHPKITPSFLETLDIYDKNGKAAGLRYLDGGHYLVGVKHRKGPRLAEQRIKLDRISLRLVWQILAITKAHRSLLRRDGSDEWRRLFITCGKGFSYPSAIKKFVGDSCRRPQREKRGMELAEICNLPAAEGLDIAHRLYLRAVRASVGLMVLIDTHSSEAMSQALGHEKYNEELLRSYFPPALQAFFRARWIRAFQTNLVVLVTKDSSHQLEASGFRTAEALDEFMRFNALPHLASALEQGLAPPSATTSVHSANGRFVLNANALTLSILCGAAHHLRNHRHTTGPIARYWGEFGEHATAFLASRRGLDPELDELLVSAQSAALTTNFGSAFDG